MKVNIPKSKPCFGAGDKHTEQKFQGRQGNQREERWVERKQTWLLNPALESKVLSVKFHHWQREKFAYGKTVLNWNWGVDAENLITRGSGTYGQTSRPSGHSQSLPSYSLLPALPLLFIKEKSDLHSSLYKRGTLLTNLPSLRIKWKYKFSEMRNSEWFIETMAFRKNKFNSSYFPPSITTLNASTYTCQQENY